MVQLYHMSRGIGEQTNLKDHHADKRSEHWAMLDERVAKGRSTYRVKTG